ncbi:TfoX/Sxy family DNA transformation protein [Vibrio mangrovi]|uniref:DNA transformation protein TfoX n=1 Tax=Vibrio mangrovi TaxID=474394 RepID=A0A1Y6ISG2_9VIBR|nr:TfoX/Sxy family DNA transformation protein [Vibrio mangrovi]MDW6003764.1 TfoX/Sxy family DNA transformation protein [Vibrio mangrovi]SMR99442.1 DNA transformation protein TfoX [Vibrio mangrovi]
MIATKFFDYLMERENFDTKSIFGDVGLFCQDAMFALVCANHIYIRGGGVLDEKLVSLNCSKYVFVKKQSISKVNYYDITELFRSGYPYLGDIISRAKALAICQKRQKYSLSNRRLRDLPNLHLTIERMLKKSGIPDVAAFFKLGATRAFLKVRQLYGATADVKLLWKFVGAIEEVHWKLIPEKRKQQVLNECCSLAEEEEG